MKFLFLFLITLPVYSNTFQLMGSGARFTLKISSKEITYSSEAFTKEFKLKECNLPLAKDLNSELISLIPSNPGDTGLKFMVDGKVINIGKEDKLLERIAAMDSRMIRFSVEEKRACR